MPLHNHLSRPIRTQHEQPRRGAPPRQQGEQVERGVIAPVQVFQDEQQERLGGQRIDHFREFPEHAFPCRPVQFMLQAFPVGSTEQPGHLHQPGRRLLA